MHNEIAKGENPEFTSFVGASAAPNHTPAVRPQITPKLCSDNAVLPTRCTVLAMHLSLVLFRFCERVLLVQYHQQSDAGQQYKNGHQEVAIGCNRLYPLSKAHSDSS
jgi:hypothetical protein